MLKVSGSTGRLLCLGLVLTVLALRSSTTTCKKIPFYILKQIDEIKSDHLMDELSKPLKPLDQGTNLKVSVGKQVALILAKSRNKRKKKVILDEFSVKDLLSLNKMSLEDCHVDKLTERRKFCEDKFAEKHVNLYAYCTKTITNLSDWCSSQVEELVKVALNKLSKLRKATKLRNIIKKVAKSETKRIKSLADTGDVTPDEVFNSVQTKGGDSFRAQVKSVCRKLDDALSMNFEIKLSDKPIDFMMDRWVDFLKYCQIVIKLSPPVDDTAHTESADSEENDDEFDEDDLDEVEESGDLY